MAVLLVIVGASLGLAACGGSDESTTATEAGTAVESSAAEKKIERIEQETKEAELEAALAKKEAAQQAVKAKKAAANRVAGAEEESEEAAIAEEESPSEPPSVIGMRLPEAESTLRAAGFKTQAENTDTTFGIVVRSHYTICSQSEPHGDVVTVLAQKYGC
ncbi:MAG TPA: hypothetical protein VFI09_00110 [Solirubrobacterales bacterium]|nr:hypothetical protein [Solirubrobacterales bacterium]